MNTRTQRRHGFSRIDLTVGSALVILLGGGFIVAQQANNEEANRIRCAANLHSIGQALLFYANENIGVFPRTRHEAGRPLSFFSRWQSTNPFAQDGPKVNDVTAALFLLLRTQDVNASAFICPSSSGHPINFGKKTSVGPQTRPSEVGVPDPISELAQSRREVIGARRPTTRTATEVLPVGDPVAENAQAISNFPKPDNLTYSFANPYPDSTAQSKGYKFYSGLGQDFALVADINPGGTRVTRVLTNQMPPPEGRPRRYQPFATYAWKFTDEQREANSPNHKGFGQNVLFADGSVGWQASPFVGTDRDNIYTRAIDNSTPAGSDLIVGSPTHAEDSVLLPAANILNQ